MAEANAGAGSADGAGAAGAGGAGAADAGSAGQGAAPWHGHTDEADVGYITGKGWKAPQDVIKSYREAERFIGRDPSTLLSLPRADDPEGLKAVFTKLGMPATADKYDITAGLPKGAKVDEGFSKQMQGIFHKANLTDAQAKILATDYNAMTAQFNEQALKDYELNVQADKSALLDKWRGGHDRMMNTAKTAATSLGFTPELLDAIENHVGYAKTYELLAEIGGKLGEDKLVSKDKDGGGFNAQLTPAEAKNQWEAKKLDTNFLGALKDPTHPGHKAAQAQQSALFAIMYPNER